MLLVALGVSMAAAAIQASATSAAKVRLSVHIQDVQKDYTTGGVAHCERMLVLVVSVPPGIVSYQASAVQTNANNAVQQFGGPPTDNPIAYGDLSYSVPKGSAGWFLAAGSGGAPCPSAGGLFTHLKAFGVRAGAVLSGRVTDKCGNAVADVAVSAHATGGGVSYATTTGSNGAYSMALSPGTYRVSASDGGVLADPSSRDVTISQGNQTADFVTAACGLTVVVKPLEKQNRAGLTDDSGTPTFFGGKNRACSSGCVDVLVTVLDHNKPLPGARVSATVTQPITGGIARYPAGVTPEGNYLCAQAMPTNCNADLRTGLTTDPKGHVRLLYWSPGLAKNGTATITARADKGSQSGHNSASIAVLAKPLVNETATLSEENITELESFAGGHPFAFAMTKESIEHAWVAYLEYWENEGAAHAVEAGGTLLEIAHIALEAKEQDGAMGMFGELFKIPPNGLGSDSATKSRAYLPTKEFVDPFAGTGVLGFGKKGLIFDYGAALAGFDKLHQITSPQAMQLVIYEISYCKQGADCTSYGPGVQSYLYIQLFSHSAAAIGKNGFSGDFSAPYNAEAWMYALPATTLAK